MTIQILRFDVFTSEPGKGNPAGVVLSADGLDDSAMQRIASATGLNDTAFISRSQEADFRIRYFSARREVDLCGHATIAASIALHARGPLSDEALPCTFSLETKAGILPITIDTSATGEKMVFMAQAPSQFKAALARCCCSEQIIASLASQECLAHVEMVGIMERMKWLWWKPLLGIAIASFVAALFFFKGDVPGDRGRGVRGRPRRREQAPA